MALAVRNLSMRFGAFTAVNGISFDVREGEIVGLIGPNGSGKSTTFGCISGTLSPSGGTIAWGGRDMTGLSADRVCRLGVGRTFQIPKPFRKLSILDNVALAAFYGSGGRKSRTASRAAAEDVLSLLGLPTDPRASVERLGAAGLKKLELARALATEPSLLLADESLGGLDESEMDQAADLLGRIRREKNITIIWVEHIMGVLMRVVDRVVVLDHGELIAQGLPQEVATDPRVIEVYLGRRKDG